MALLSGCKVQPPKPPLVETVAILPFDNSSNDINAADFLQKKVYLAMKSGVYQVRSIQETNEFLKEKGITDGGQLPVLDPRLIAKDLNVQALLYGHVENFGSVNIGFYTEKKVTLALWMVDGTTGEKLWECTKTGVTRNFTLDSKKAKENLVGGLAAQVVDKMLKVPLEDETNQAVVQTLRSLPGFNFTGFAVDEDDPNRAAKKSAADLIKGQIKGGQ